MRPHPLALPGSTIRRNPLAGSPDANCKPEPDRKPQGEQRPEDRVERGSAVHEKCPVAAPASARRGGDAIVDPPPATVEPPRRCGQGSRVHACAKTTRRRCSPFDEDGVISLAR